VLKSKSGISKVYFVELPKEVQERFGYDAGTASPSRVYWFCARTNERRLVVILRDRNGKFFEIGHVDGLG
jgi:hypothetical protein